MSFREFKEELLVAMVLAAQANPGKSIEPIDVVTAKRLTFRTGWLRQAVKALHDQGLIQSYFTMGGGENGGMSSFVTGAGIEEAEDIANRNGYDLYDELDEASTAHSADTGPVVPASDRIVKIDHNSPQYIDIRNKLDETITATRASNSLREDNPDLANQRIAELEAGKTLISAVQADRSLVERLLLPALRWVGEKIADNVVSAIVGLLITLIAAYFGLVL